jgi:hypothetical protein
MGKQPTKIRSKTYKKSHGLKIQSKKRSKTRGLKIQIKTRSKTRGLKIQSKTNSSHSRAVIREIPYSAQIIDEYNTIAENIQTEITPLLRRLDDVHFIFLFAGEGYIEQMLIEKTRQETNIQSIHMVDTEYSPDEKIRIRKGFPEIDVHFYSLKQLHTVPIDLTSICMGIRPQLQGITPQVRELDDFIRKYKEINTFPIYLIKLGKIISIDPSEPIQSAVSRLYLHDTSDGEATNNRQT